MLQEAPSPVPVQGQASTAGAWLALAPTGRGLTLLGRTAEAAALHPPLEARVASGFVTHHEAGDAERARALLAEAAALYDALGRPAFAQRARASHVPRATC